NMIDYLLDDVIDDPDLYEPAEIDLRRAKRQEARRRFVLTHISGRSYLDLQKKGVNPATMDQETADNQFREIFRLDPAASLSVNDVDREEMVEKLRRFTTQNPADPAADFEKAFTYIKAVTDAHPVFRYELIRQGVLQQYYQDNVRDIEITVYHDWDNLDELMEQLRKAEVDVGREGGQLNISIVKGFRKDHFHNVLKEVERDPQREEVYLGMFKGMTLEETKAEILKRVTAMDEEFFDVPAAAIKKEFEEAYEEIVRQETRLQIFRGKELADEDIRRRLIFAYIARLNAVADVFKFQEDINRLEQSHPRYAKRIGGISSVGEEIQVIDGIPVGYLNWTESPIFRKARMMGYKRSVHVGELWSPGRYTDALRRIIQLIDIGVERLAHVTVLGLDYDRIPPTLIQEQERGRAKFLQNQIFELLKRKGTHVELQPTSQMINAPIYRKYHKYKNHVAGMFLNQGINFSVNPDDSSVYDTNPTREMFEIAMANPDMSPRQIHALYKSARAGRFYQNPDELIASLSAERRRVLQAQEAFKLAAIVVFGSARIPDGHPQQYVADELGRLIFQMGLSVRTGGGPSVMKWPFMAYIEQREQFLQQQREVFAGTQEEWDEYANDVRLQSATQSIRILLNFWEPASPFGEEKYDFFHFAFCKMGLHLKAKRVISLHGGIGTWDEILETWRRDRDLVLVGKEFWQPILDAARASWQEGGFTDQIRTWPKVVDTAKEALADVPPDNQNGGLELTTEEQTEASVREMDEG
ncbi:MAG: LOG family protein, partial [Candidatus Omnitrophica bacterium]|nr:LOG family protein [Candidatus Omnitrophota bacterium]